MNPKLWNLLEWIIFAILVIAVIVFFWSLYDQPVLPANLP